MKRAKLLFFGAVAGICLLLCFLLGVPWTEQETQPETTVTLSVSETGQTLTLPLEEYVAGVLLAELTPSHHPACFRALAVAVRTLAVKKQGVLSDDPGVFQGYWTAQTASAKLGEAYPARFGAGQAAARDTDGLVLSYQGELALTTYFACSSGATCASQWVWGGALPYLVGVDSSWDTASSDYCSQKVISAQELAQWGQGVPRITPRRKTAMCWPWNGGRKPSLGNRPGSGWG